VKKIGDATEFRTKTTNAVLNEVLEERRRQHDKWGQQDHPDGTGNEHWTNRATLAKELCFDAFRKERGTFRHVMEEEVYEAFAEADQVRLREELVQVAAVAVAWIESIDRRGAKS
jgi:siderophore synthetase component